MHDDVNRQIVATGSLVRNVAFGEGQRVATTKRPGLDGASEQTSNQFRGAARQPGGPDLARPRVELDCGGLMYVIVGYGDFRQIVILTVSGHVSTAVETGTDVRSVVEAVPCSLRATVYPWVH